MDNTPLLGLRNRTYRIVTEMPNWKIQSLIADHVERAMWKMVPGAVVFNELFDDPDELNRIEIMRLGSCFLRLAARGISMQHSTLDLVRQITHKYKESPNCLYFTMAAKATCGESVLSFIAMNTLVAPNKSTDCTKELDSEQWKYDRAVLYARGLVPPPALPPVETLKPLLLSNDREVRLEAIRAIAHIHQEQTLCPAA